MSSERAGTGRGKLLLFGEHAAVYGHPACGLSLDSTMRVRIREIVPSRWRLPELDDGNRGMLGAFLESAEPLFPKELFRPGEISVESTIPVGMGFGSSAAWCAAFARAILGGSTDREMVWEKAHRAEEFFHGTPSGIDTGLAILNGLYAFTPSPPRLPGARPLEGFPMHFVVGAVPREGSTRTLVGDLRRRIESKDPEAKRLVEELGALSRSAIEILATGDSARIGEIGKLADEAQTLLDRLGLSTAALDTMIGIGRKNGALGGKLSGAGGGGAFYLLFEDLAGADRAYRAIADAVRNRIDRGETVLFRYSR